MLRVLWARERAGGLGTRFGPHVPLCGARKRVTTCPVLLQVHAKDPVQGAVMLSPVFRDSTSTVLVPTKKSFFGLQLISYLESLRM